MSLALNKELQFSNRIVCGIDEVGRGPLAGPVIAAACILDLKRLPIGVNDSKKLTKVKREALFQFLTENSIYGIGEASVEEIDQINILQASLLAMKRAFDNLAIKPDVALVDGNQKPILDAEIETIVQGDSKVLSIAAASIIAKVTRDKIMEEYDIIYPGYGFAKHAGYGTRYHIDYIYKYGITEIHRKSFAPIKNLLEIQIYEDL